MLKMTKIKLELIIDPDIAIIQCNGCAMSKFLPTSGFKWIDPIEFDLNKGTSNRSKGRVS